MHRLLREPLLHFLVIGGLLFALYAAFNRDAMRAPDAIVVDQKRLDALAGQFESTWQRAPAPAELQRLVDDWVREEVLYREGVAAGLEQDDAIVRRRVVQKMQFMAEGITTGAPPAEAELQAWLDAHPGDYRVEPRYAFAQVFFDPQRHRSDLDAAVARAREALAADPGARVGDGTLLPARMPLVPRSEVARVYGQAFSAALDGLPEGQWEAVRSGFGAHLVRVEQRVAGHAPALVDVRDEVERDLARARGDAAAQAYNATLRRRYDVRIEGDVAKAVTSASREARRGQASGQ